MGDGGRRKALRRIVRVAERGEIDAAMSMLRRWIDSDPTEVEPRVLLAELTLREGDAASALAQARVALGLAPGYNRVAGVAAAAAHRLGRPSELVGMGKELVEARPEDADAHRALMWLSVSAGNLLEAAVAAEWLVEHEVDVERANEVLEQIAQAVGIDPAEDDEALARLRDWAPWPATPMVPPLPVNGGTNGDRASPVVHTMPSSAIQEAVTDLEPMPDEDVAVVPDVPSAAAVQDANEVAVVRAPLEFEESEEQEFSAAGGEADPSPTTADERSVEPDRGEASTDESEDTATLSVPPIPAADPDVDAEVETSSWFDAVPVVPTSEPTSADGDTDSSAREPGAEGFTPDGLGDDYAAVPPVPARPTVAAALAREDGPDPRAAEADGHGDHRQEGSDTEHAQTLADLIPTDATVPPVPARSPVDEVEPAEEALGADVLPTDPQESASGKVQDDGEREPKATRARRSATKAVEPGPGDDEPHEAGRSGVGPVVMPSGQERSSEMSDAGGRQRSESGRSGSSDDDDAMNVAGEDSAVLVDLRTGHPKDEPQARRSRTSAPGSSRAATGAGRHHGRRGVPSARARVVMGALVVATVALVVAAMADQVLLGSGIAGIGLLIAAGVVLQSAMRRRGEQAQRYEEISSKVRENLRR